MLLRPRGASGMCSAACQYFENSSPKARAKAAASDVSAAALLDADDLSGLPGAVLLVLLDGGVQTDPRAPRAVGQSDPHVPPIAEVLQPHGEGLVPSRAAPQRPPTRPAAAARGAGKRAGQSGAHHGVLEVPTVGLATTGTNGREPASNGRDSRPLKTQGTPNAVSRRFLPAERHSNDVSAHMR
jgi:hypothetical protein